MNGMKRRAIRQAIALVRAEIDKHVEAYGSAMGNAGYANAMKEEAAGAAAAYTKRAQQEQDLYRENCIALDFLVALALDDV